MSFLLKSGSKLKWIKVKTEFMHRFPLRLSIFHPTEFRMTFTTEINIHGYSGKGVIITCLHKWAEKNTKYFCKYPCKYGTGVLVTSDQSPKGRFTLEDFGNGSFTVNIADLQESDSGIYWCGVKRVVIDTYVEVNLTVSQGKNDSISPMGFIVFLYVT